MDNQQDTSCDFRGYVAQILTSADPKSVTRYAAASLVGAFEKYGLTALDTDSLKLWVASMLMEGMTLSSVRKYAGKIHTLYNEWRGKDAADPFVEIQPVLEQSYQPDDADVLHNLDAVKRLFLKNEASADWSAVNIFFYLLYNADATLLDMLGATFDNAPRYCAQVDEIVKSCDGSFGRKYLFNLKQSRMRPGQILRTVTADLTALMQDAGMKIAGGYVREEITAIWIAAAMKQGVDICDIRSIVPAVPYRYRALSLIRKKEMPPERMHRIVCLVADSLNDNAPRWFVMKLRKGVGLDEVREKIDAELPGRLNAMELYYPTRTVAKRVGKKIRKEEIPYVPDMLFFRTQYNKVRSLFSRIGDMAWCLKVSGAPDSRYSVISYEEMTNFQRCVGQFTPDIRVELAEMAPTLTRGRMVRITGGMMEGYTGMIEDIDDDKGTRKFFLRISSDSALNWCAEVEDYYIEPIN